MPFIALATTNAFNGPHESFMPRLQNRNRNMNMKHLTLLKEFYEGEDNHRDNINLTRLSLSILYTLH